MDSTPSHCTNQYNVGVLDGIGVGLLWVYVLRWILLKSYNDDINILFCLPNPAVEDPRYRGWKQVLFLAIDTLIPYGSLYYTVIQAVRCGEKLLSCLIVLVSLYEIVFKLKRLRLRISIWVISICGHYIGIPDTVVALSSAMAIGYGGQIRNIGIAGLVVVALSICGEDTVQKEEYKTNELHHEIASYSGVFVLVYGLIYPILIACFITVIVRNNDQWVPRPQNVLEYILLVLRIITGFGISDILKLIFLKMYQCFKPDPPMSDKDLILDELYWWGHRTERIVRIVVTKRTVTGGHVVINLEHF
ncbi:hypothetical protein BG004_001647 [Podila humilis]|nr:hypothetical protein BG004_001647 [Podila humilis]